MKKIIPYGHQYIDAEDIKAVVNVLRSDFLTQGPMIEEFERKLCNYCKCRFAIACSSGTAALHIACLAAGISKNDEVITSPITFVASANCVLYCGGRPVFTDIEKDTINIDPQEIETKITKRTKAIIPVDFSGHPCKLEAISAIAKRHDLTIIEDACHALGAEYKGLKIGSCGYSDMTVFSFHPVKHITTGEGGAVLTNNRNIYQKLLMLRNHGITKDRKLIAKRNRDYSWYYEMQELGFNYRMTDIQAALGSSQLKKLDRFIVRRRRIAEIYNKAFKNNDFFDTPVEKEYAFSSYHLYPIRLKDKFISDRNNIFQRLRVNGLGVQVHYIPVYLQPYYRKTLGYKSGACLNSEKYYSRAISIPIYPSMTDSEVRRVIRIVKEAFHGR